MLYGMEKSLMAGWVDLYERIGKAFVSPLPLVGWSGGEAFPFLFKKGLSGSLLLFRNHLHKQAVYGKVVVQFGMESCYQLFALPSRNDMAINLGQYLHILAHIGDVGRTDKGHWHGMVYAFYVAFYIEAAQLTSVCVAANGGIHC